MPHNVTALYACQKMYRLDVGEGANVGRLRAFIPRPVGNFRHSVIFKETPKPMSEAVLSSLK